jgi:hypothetical protein
MDRAFSPLERLRGVFPGPVAQAGMERPVGPRRLRRSDVCRLAETARFGGRVVWDTKWARGGFPLSQGKPTRPFPRYEEHFLHSCQIPRKLKEIQVQNSPPCR